MAPTLDFLRGTATMRCLRELEESQWWTRERILELQNERLRYLVKYAYDSVPYYRRVFDERGLKPDDIKTSHDLVKLPVLTKQLIRRNFDEITASGFPAGERVKLSTGGSTGEPLLFYSTRHCHINLSFAARQRGYSAIGFKLGDKHARLSIRYGHETRNEKLWKTAIEFFRRQLFLDVHELSADTMPHLAGRIERFQPKFIRSAPEVIEELARFIKAQGKRTLRPKAIVTGAAQLYDYQRDLFREVFGCDTYDYYGAVEQHTIACECPQHSGYHIAAEHVVVEIVDDEGIPVPSGEEGRIVITNLYNYAMPFIRYEVGDVGVASDRTCPCGRGLPLLQAVSGRTFDVILTKSRGPIPGIRLWRPMHALFANLGVEQFQIVQETYEKVVVKFVLDKQFREQHASKLEREVIQEYKCTLGEDMDISVEFVDYIPLTSAGKRKIIISNLTPGDDTASTDE